MGGGGGTKRQQQRSFQNGFGTVRHVARLAVVGLCSGRGGLWNALWVIPSALALIRIGTVVVVVWLCRKVGVCTRFWAVLVRTFAPKLIF